MAFRSSVNFAAGASTSTYTKPAGTVSTDILLAHFADESGAANAFLCTGWTLVGRIKGGSSVNGTMVFWAPGSVASLAFTDSLGSTFVAECTISAWSGRNTTSPISAFTTGFTNDGNSFTLAPTVTAVSGDDLVISLSQQNGTLPGSASGVTDFAISNDASAGWAYGYVAGVGGGTTTAYSRATTSFLDRNTVVVSLAAASGGGAGSTVYVGQFDSELVSTSWFDTVGTKAGWYDSLMVVNGSSPNIFVVSSSESGSATDVFSSIFLAPLSITESSSASDSNSGLQTSPVSRTETGAAADLESVIQAYSSALTDAASAADLSTSLANFVANEVDSAAAADSSSTIYSAVASGAEAGAAADTPSATYSAISSVSESGSSSDSTSGVASTQLANAESASSSDTNSSVAVFISSGSESGSAVETNSASASFVSSQLEAGSGSDSSTSLRTQVATITEATQRTNLVTNSIMSGAVVGNVSSGGVWPTGWNGSVTAGLTVQILGTGTLYDGTPYFDYRVSGTNSTGGIVYPDVYAPTSGPGVQGDTFTATMYLETIAGSRSGFANPLNSLSLSEENSGGGYITSSSVSAPTAGVYSVTRTFTDPGATFPGVFTSLAVSIGGVVDLTLRIGHIQLEKGPASTQFIATTSVGSPTTVNATELNSAVSTQVTSVTETARRTNYLINSEDLTAASWTKSGVTASANLIADPFSGLSDKLIETATTSSHWARALYSKSTISTPLVASIYVKSAERTFSDIALHDGAGNGYYSRINLTTGVLTGPTSWGAGWSNPSSSIANVGGGWYRVQISAVSNTASFAELRIYSNDGVAAFDGTYLGNSSNGLYYFGAQLEDGLVATPYIPTVATSVTVNASDYSSLSSGQSASITDSASAADATSSNASFVSSETETGAATDQPSVISTNLVSSVESSSGSDSPSVTLSSGVSTSDSGSAVDSSATTAVSQVALTETGSASDLDSVISTQPVSLVETAQRTNLVPNSIFVGATTGNNINPTGWFATGVTNLTNNLLTDEVVGGYSTKIIALRRTNPTGLEGCQQNISGVVTGVPYTASIYIRVPTGITATAAIMYAGVATPAQNFIAAAATLNAQQKDVWVRYSIPITYSAITSQQFSIACSNDVAGTGFDFALPQYEISNTATVFIPTTGSSLTVNSTEASSNSVITLASDTEPASAADVSSSNTATSVSDSEAASSLDSSGSTLTSNVADAESGSAVDTPSSTYTTPASESEAGSALDSSNGVTGTIMLGQENGSALDSSQSLMTAVVSETESGSATDAPLATFVAPVTSSNSGSAVDSQSFSFVTVSTETETGAALDASSTIWSATASSTEASSSLDAPSATMTGVVSNTASGSGTDSPSATYVTPTSNSESGSATSQQDTTGSASVSITESGASIDAESSTQSSSAAVIESVSASDLISSGAFFVVTQNDSGSSLDNTSVSATFVSSNTSSGSANDSTSSVSNAVAQSTEAGSGVDSTSSVLSTTSSTTEPASATDVTFQGSVTAVSDTESGVATTSQTGAGTSSQSTSEAGVANDTSTVQNAAVASLNESGSSLDSSSGLASMGVAASEAGAAVSVQSASWTALASVSEPGAATDSNSTSAVVISNIAEYSVSSDQTTVNMVFSVASLMNAIAVDVSSETLIQFTSSTEVISAADTVSSVANILAVYSDSGLATDSLNLTYSVNTSESGVSLDSIIVSKSTAASILESISALDSSTLIALSWRNSKLLNLQSKANVYIQPVKITKIALNTLYSKIIK